MSPDEASARNVEREVERALQPLRDAIAAQAADLDRLAARVWALELANGVLCGLLPVARAEEAAQALAMALDSAPPGLRDSVAAQGLRAWRESLLKAHSEMERRFGPMLG